MVCNIQKMPEVQQDLGGDLSDSGETAAMPRVRVFCKNKEVTE